MISSIFQKKMISSNKNKKRFINLHSIHWPKSLSFITFDLCWFSIYYYTFLIKTHLQTIFFERTFTNNFNFHPTNL